MEFDGVAYSRGRLHRLACAAGGMAGDVSEIRTGFEGASGAARVALGDDDYGRRYWQARGRRMEGIGTGLELLAAALHQQGARVQGASHRYESCEDASALRPS